MNWLTLSDTFDVTIPRPFSEVLTELRQRIQPRREFRLGLEVGAYEGEVFEFGFNIRRVAIGYRDSRATVVVRGHFQSQADSTLVRVSVRPGRLMLIFAWMTALIGAGITFSTLVTLVEGTLAGAANVPHWQHLAIGIAVGLGMPFLVSRTVQEITREVRGRMEDWCGIPNKSDSLIGGNSCT